MPPIVPYNTNAPVHALAWPAGRCHKGTVRRLRDFAAIRDFLSDREIEKLQVAADERREARMRRAATPEAEAAPGVPEPDAHPATTREGPAEAEPVHPRVAPSDSYRAAIHPTS